MSESEPTPPPSAPDPAELLGRALESQPATGQPLDWDPPSPEVLQAQLQGYQVTQFLARGGMGAVYRGMHVSLDRQVAIKILPPQLRHGDPQYATRFQQEARAMAQLNHPGIVSVYDFGQMADGTLYFIMEFIDGTDVGQMVLKQGRLSSAHAMAITAHVCDALHYAHERGIVHRDIKPANIMVGYDGRVKVADFGLAKSVRQVDTGLTQSGYVMGTPHFVAPEALIIGVEVDQRADIYAVGVMLYQMLTGKVPQGMFEMPSMQVPGLDPRYDHIIARAMREDREQRYPTIQEMRRALDGILTQPVAQSQTVPQGRAPAAAGQSPATSRPRQPAAAPPPPRKSSAVPMVATAAVIMAVGCFFLLGEKAPQEKAAAPVDTAAQPATAVVRADSTTVSNDPVTKATREQPFINSLGMKFVSVPILEGETDGPPVAFSIWETRVQDYETFVNDTGRRWSRPSFTQGPDHPAVIVTWDDATAFCAWLTEREHKSGALGADLLYRLPTDHEWSCASGVGGFEDPHKRPAEKHLVVKAIYPWGSTWPPPPAAGNMSGEECIGNEVFGRAQSIQKDYRDDFTTTTSPVGSFPANSYGLHDMSGNAWEWCSDWLDASQHDRVARGGAFTARAILSSDRLRTEPDFTDLSRGFRCVLASRSAVTPTPQMPVVADAPETPPPAPSISGPTLFLGDLKPVIAAVGWGVYRVNAYEDFDIRAGRLPLIGGKPCTQYLFAHASSRLEFSIPEGYRFFTAIGFGPTTTKGDPKEHWSWKKSWKYLVKVDGRTVFESGALISYANGELPMEVPLPPGSKTLSLIMDDMGDGNSDHSMWGYPMLHRSSETLPAKAAPQPRVRTATQQKLFDLEMQSRAAWDRASAQTVQAEIAALGKSYLASGFPRAITDATRRADDAEIAALRKEQDAYIANPVVPPADQPGIHPGVQKLRATYHEARKKIQTAPRVMPLSLYEPYFAALRKLLPDSGDDRQEVMKRYEQLRLQAGFHTSATPAMSPEFKRRCGGLERLSWVEKAGGSRETEVAVNRGIHFLHTKQNPDGSWGSDLQVMNTALSLLAFLGHCETMESPLYGDTVMKAILYLIETSRKNPEGLISANLASMDSVLEHGMALYALAEAYAVARAEEKMLPGLRETIEKAAKVTLSHQMANGGWGGEPDKGFTTSGDGGVRVSVWQCMALDAVAKAGIKAGPLSSMSNHAINYFYSQRQPGGKYGMEGVSPRMQPIFITGPVAHAISLLRPDASNLPSSFQFYVDQFRQKAPTWADADLHTWFHLTAAMRNHEKYWPGWNRLFLPILLSAQTPAGTWQHSTVFPGGGEIDSTALAVLMLQSYYRGVVLKGEAGRD